MKRDKAEAALPFAGVLERDASGRVVKVYIPSAPVWTDGKRCSPRYAVVTLDAAAGLTLTCRKYNATNPNDDGEPCEAMNGRTPCYHCLAALILRTSEAGGRVPYTTRPVSDPLPTVAANGTHIGLCQPFVMQMSQSGSNGSRTRPADQPTADDMAVVSPFVLTVNHATPGEQAGRRAHSVDDPVPTLTTEKSLAVVQPFIMSAGGPNVDARSIDQPVNTVLTRDHMAIVKPFIVPYYGTGVPDSVDDPVSTITTKDRLGLVQPGPRYDILFRMLQPHELALAMSFPAGYQFTGNRAEQVKQIGNAVPVGLARAICFAMLSA
jgi:hypothetical protein